MFNSHIKLLLLLYNIGCLKKEFPPFHDECNRALSSIQDRKRDSFIFPAFSLVRVSWKDSLKLIGVGMAIRVVTDI